MKVKATPRSVRICLSTFAIVPGMFATWELIEVRNHRNTPLGIRITGTDLEALERSRTEREARGDIWDLCVVAQSIGAIDFAVPNDERERRRYHLRRTSRGWEFDEFGLGLHRSLKNAASAILWPTRGQQAELQVFRADGSIQCIALVDQWDEFFQRSGMNPTGRNGRPANKLSFETE